MFKVKNIAVAAASGFVLSFLISAFSTHRIGVSFLRGLIFAFVFAALDFAIGVVNSRFLEVEGGIVAEPMDESSRKNRAGSVVNITIDDENLTQEEKAPAFDVSSGTQFFMQKENSAGNAEKNDVPAALMETEPKKESSGSDDVRNSAENGGFVPVQLGKPVENDDAVKEIAVMQSASEPKKATGVSEIDSLPDIGEFSDQNGDFGEGNSVSSVISDSEFAQSGNLNASAQMTEGGEMMKQDSKIIASAIRTLLKKED